MSGRPPPFPPTAWATTPTSLPACTFAVRSFVTAETIDTAPSSVDASTTTADFHLLRSESTSARICWRSMPSARAEGMDRQQMRALVDSLRNKWKSAVVVLASTEDGAVSIVSAVTKDLTAKVHAGKLVGVVAQAVGGKGGGRPDMAEGGGKDPAGLDAALEAVYQDVESKL